MSDPRPHRLPTSLDAFIAEHVTGRNASLLAEDLALRDGELRDAIRGARALVIGGAGTIGSSFIRALLPYEPASLVVVDTNENGLTELTRDLQSGYSDLVPPDYRTYPIGYASGVFAKLLDGEPPFEVVANFAAHKHVRSERDPLCIEAMVRNNLIDAERLLARLAARPPRRFFCVSTDKAANPVNVMGASKKLMEEAILAYAEELHVTTARFANVAFSNGSLLDGYDRRLARSQPLVAPTDIRRYFVSPRESGELCLLACVCADSGDIVFPKLAEGQMQTFAGIAERYLAARGLRPAPFDDAGEARRAAAAWAPGQPYPLLLFASDTSGEKGYEEFFTDAERVDGDRFAALGVVVDGPRRSLRDVRAVISQLEETFAAAGSKADLVSAMERLLPGFDHAETGRSLDHRM